VPDIGEYSLKLYYAPDGHRLTYERVFDFGRSGHLLFPAAGYPALKQVFDQVQELDNYTVELRPGSH
jgi:hypothetical protein